MSLRLMTRAAGSGARSISQRHGIRGAGSVPKCHGSATLLEQLVRSVCCVIGTVRTFEDSFEAAASDLLLECYVLRESIFVDSQNMPCATLKRWVISVYL
jgi:hypothetical protein